MMWTPDLRTLGDDELFAFTERVNARSRQRYHPGVARVPWQQGWLTMQTDGILIEYADRALKEPPKSRLGRVVAAVQGPQTPPRPPNMIMGANMLRVDCAWPRQPAAGESWRPIPGRVLTFVCKGGLVYPFPGVPPELSVALLDDVARRGVVVVEDGVPWPAPMVIQTAQAAPASPTEFRQLQCPRCSAPLEQSVRQCPYCKTPLILA